MSTGFFHPCVDSIRNASYAECVKKLMKLTVFALFIGFQAAQSLHTHKAVSQDNCQTCQVVHQTPTVGAEGAQHLITRLVFQRFLVSRNETFVPSDVVSLASIRAPPAA